MSSSSIPIAIRSIQHYLYCSHRWGLLEIDKAWAENVFVTKANLMHERVHNPQKQYTAKGTKVFTAVSVYCDQEPYQLYGVTDCLELKADKQGVIVSGEERKYQLRIVEYKPSQPKHADYHEEDLMQVFAQKICVDSMFGCDCDAVIYYADVKKRISLPLHENAELYKARLLSALSEMRECMGKGEIPPIRQGQYCGGCSMQDLCMPIKKQYPGLREEIRALDALGE